MSVGRLHHYTIHQSQAAQNGLCREQQSFLKNGSTGQPLVNAPIDKLWAWGDIPGASKGMNNMVEETAAATANLVARSKGWQPYEAQAMGGASPP